ncbi:MAG: thioredoxin-disulfide reductase [Lachnospiraceae bacterium]|nr:thioredoxin-disulfide reductase [Lachnospiraceae bacterium]
MYDIVIIGAGTAGLSAGIYGVRAGKKVLILEEKYYGGQIINTPHIANYPGIKNISGFEFATNLYEQAIELGVEIQYEKVIKIEDNNKIKKVITEENSYDCKSIIIATGAKNRKLGVENEEKFTGAGVSYCATCDGAFFRGKDVAVVGGGNTALEDAGFLAEYCNKVYLIHRREEFRGEEKLVNILKEKSNVEFILNSTVSAIEGSDIVEGITVKNVISNEIRRIDVNGIFIAIGQAPDNTIFSEIINLDEKGYVIADETCKTNLEGIFTAGDCRTKKIRQLTTAASDGSVAALAACEWCGTN